MNYLGYHMGNGQIRPCDSPTKDQEGGEVVPGAVGLVGWYRRFVPNLAYIAVPLTNLLSKTVKNPIPLTGDCEIAFATLEDQAGTHLHL